MIFLLQIKGNKFQAGQAAAKRGFGLVHIREVGEASIAHPFDGYTTGHVSTTRNRLDNWMRENINVSPLPIGALIDYQLNE